MISQCETGTERCPFCFGKEKGMEIIEKTIDELIPYEHNPRKNDDAVEAVASGARMNKPMVFNYKDHERALDRIAELEAEVARLQEAKANLEIRCRILEADHGQDESQIQRQDLGTFGYRLP